MGTHGIRGFLHLMPIVAFAACGESTMTKCGPGTHLKNGTCQSDTMCSVTETSSTYIISCPDGEITVVDKDGDGGEGPVGGVGGGRGGLGGRGNSGGSAGTQASANGGTSHEEAGAPNDGGAPGSTSGTGHGASGGKNGGAGNGGSGAQSGTAGSGGVAGGAGSVSGNGGWSAGSESGSGNGGSAGSAGNGGGDEPACTPGERGCVCGANKFCTGELACQSSICVERPAPPAVVSLGHFELPPGPFDLELDAERNRLFASYGGDGVVRALDLDNGEITTIPTGYRAEFLSFDPIRDEVLVSLPTQTHSAYLWTEDQEGYIAAIDAVTLADPTPIWFPLDPWQLVGDGRGHAIVMGASGQWTNLASINLETGWYTLVYGPRQGTNIRLHPARDRVYGADNGLSPSDIERYNLSTDGVVTRAADSPYHGDYPMCGDLRIHPSGDTIYTRCGHVFLASNSPPMDMTWVADMGLAWNDLAFDASGRYALLLTATGKALYIYDTETLTPSSSLTANPADRIFTGPGYVVLARQAVQGVVPYTDVEVLSFELP